MSFAIGDVVERSFDRLTTTAGILIVGALGVVGVAQTVVMQDVVRGILEGVLGILDDPALRADLTAEQLEAIESAEQGIESTIADMPLALGIDPWLAALLWLVFFVVSLAVIVVAIDTFGNERDEISGLETERLGWKTLNLFVGIVAFWIIFTIGLVLFVLPGLIFAIFMFFFPAAIVLHNESFVSAFVTSARTVQENVLETLGIVAVSIVALVVLWIVGALIPGVAGTIIEEFISAIGMAFVFAMMALAYLGAVENDEPETGESPAGGVTTETV